MVVMSPGPSMTNEGLPQIGFTGLNAVLDKGFDRKAVENLSPGGYVALDCTLTKTAVSIFPVLRECTHVQSITAVLADAYETAYEQNAFKADNIFKDQEMVIHGEVRQNGKLISGEDYVELMTGNGSGAVTNIISTDSEALIREYAKVGDAAVLACRGGYRYNLVGSVGTRDCRFLPNY